MIRVILVFLTLGNLGLIQAQSARLDVTDFGVISDTSILSTQGVQSAIDSCYSIGGGIVHIPKGIYTIGTIVLKSKVNLELADGAILFASRNINDYRMPLNEATKPVLIYANGAKNIAISGKGEINGQARHVYEDLRKTDRFIENITAKAKLVGVEMKRYYIVKPDVGLINLAGCKNVTLTDFTVRESSFWSVHLVRCVNVDISAVSVYSSLEKGVNADGLDINSCQKVRIKNCTIETGDDAIVLKTRYSDPCKNVIVSNCTLSSSSTALKIGTESRGDFEDIVFENCKVLNSNRGLSIVVLDGASVINVRFSNISIECQRRHFNWWGNADPIWLYVGKRYEDSAIGEIRNVTFRNISASVMGTSKIESAYNDRISQIAFNNLSIHMRIEDYLDKRANHIFYAKSVDNLILNNINFKWDEDHAEPLWESAFYVEDAVGFELNGFTGRQGIINTDTPAMQLINVSQSSLDKIRFLEGTEVGVYISGENTKNISLGNLDLDKVCKKVVDYQVDKAKDGL